MKILITAPQDSIFKKYFPQCVLEQLYQIGEVVLNPYSRNFTREELREVLADVDIVITHWGTPQIDKELLEGAPRLKLMAHGAGTVAHIASEAFYEREIPVLSANAIMAEYVAEATLGYLIAGAHKMPQLDRITREDRWESKNEAGKQKSLIGSSVGMIGLGTIARRVLDMLAPFRCRVYVYDPYATPEALSQWTFAVQSDFETAMSQPFVTLHAAQTPETWHMIDENALKRMPDDGILVNSSRGSLVDTQALIRELESGRIYAVLDVYEQEGTGKIPRELLEMKSNTFLQPHMAAAPVTHEMMQGIIDDIKRFINHEPLKLQVSLQQYRLMTQE